MPKRKSESKEDRWMRKMKKYEARLSLRQRDRGSNSDYEGNTWHVEDYDMTQSSNWPEYFPPELELEAEYNPYNLEPEQYTAQEAVQPADDAAGATLAAVPEERASPAPGPSSAPVVATAPAPAVVPEPVPSTSALLSTGDEVPVPAVIDPELLAALGILNADTPEWGNDIHNDIAKGWEPILKIGLTDDVRDSITKNILFPKNCTLIKAPLLNPEINAMLTESAKNRDARICKKQSQLGCVLSILGEVMTNILTKTGSAADHLRLLSEAGKLVVDSQYAETETRRALIVPMLDKGYIEPFKDRKRDAYLFGDKLTDFIRSSQGIRRSGQIIQSVVATNNLNWRGPPQQSASSRATAAARGPRFYRRGGGGGGARRSWPYHPPPLASGPRGRQPAHPHMRARQLPPLPPLPPPPQAPRRHHYGPPPPSYAENRR